MNSSGAVTSRLAVALSAATLSLIALAGCAAPAATDDAPPAASDESSAPAEQATDADLAVTDSDLGEIVVDGAGMTVYMFTKDTQGSGESVCAGDCLAKWPPVGSAADVPVVDGVTGELGTITATDGSTQVTLNGWPLYYFAGDAAAGDTTGQAVGDVWWVLSPAGEPITS